MLTHPNPLLTGDRLEPPRHPATGRGPGLQTGGRAAGREPHERHGQPAERVAMGGASSGTGGSLQQPGSAGAELRRFPAAPLSAKRRRERATAAEVHAHAARLGLTGPLGARAEEAGGGNAFQEQLRQWAREEAAEAWDLPRFATALEWLDDYVVATERQPLFVPACGPDATQGQLHNRETLDTFGIFIRRSAPKGKTKGEHVSSESIQGYQTAVYTIRCREAGYDIAPAAVNLLNPLLLKRWRAQDGPRSDRKLCRGLRMHHFERLAGAGGGAQLVRRDTLAGVIEWAAGLAGHNLMLRGGEVGVPDGIAPDARRVLTWRSFEWRAPRAESSWRPWLLIWVVPIKDTQARRKGYPCPVCRRHDGSLGTDPLCVYDALAVAWWARRGTAGQGLPDDGAGVPMDGWWDAAPCGTAPAMDTCFFAHADGTPFCTADVRRMVQRWGQLLGEADFKGKSLRIGGATDWFEEMGQEGAQVIRRRGRWDSDCTFIYQRPLLANQLRASAQLGRTRGADIEEVCRGFAQAAIR